MPVRQPKPGDISEQILADASGDEPEVLARLHFLGALIAAEHGDQQQLRRSLAALEAADRRAPDVDRAKLRGRLEMAEHNWGRGAGSVCHCRRFTAKGIGLPDGGQTAQ